MRLTRSEITRENLRRLVEYWEGLRPAGALPSRRDVRPEDLPYVLSQLMLVDVVREPPPHASSGCSFRFRLVGTRIEQAGHPGLQGRWVHELNPLPYRRLVQLAYEEAVQEGEPSFHRVALDHGGQQLRYERVILPLASDGKRVDTLLAGTDWDPVNEEFFRTYPAIGG